MNFLAWLVLGALVGALFGYAEGKDVAGAVTGAILGVVAVVIMRFDRMKLGKGSKARSQPSPRAGMSSFVIVVLVLGALALVAIAALIVKLASDDEAPGLPWRDASVQLRPVSALKGVAIGQSLEEVTARLGAFDPEPTTAGEAASPARNYQQSGGGSLRLRVEDGRVSRVSYECRPGDATRLNRIACHDVEYRVLEVFGNGARRLCAKVPASSPDAAMAPSAFAFDVLDTGTRYISLQGQVRGFIIMAPADLEGALGEGLWHRC